MLHNLDSLLETSVLLGSGHVSNTILHEASEEMKLEFLPKIFRNEGQWSITYTEPSAGTDIGSLQTRAAELARETNSIGAIWDGQEHLDDFEPLAGIGPVYEQRLYEAGITTYAALAATTPEQLAEICQAPSMQEPNYADWIEQAKALLKE